MYGRLPKLTLKPWVRSSPRDLILQNAQVIDPANSRLLDGYQDVFIEDGLVLSVTPSGTRRATDPEKPEPIVVDLAGKYLCPYVSRTHMFLLPDANNDSSEVSLTVMCMSLPCPV